MGHEGVLFPSQSRVVARPKRTLFPTVIFALGCAALVLPTMFGVARFSWSTEQGGHGPLVLASGLWLLWREAKASALTPKPGSIMLGMAMIVPLLFIFLLARITGILQIEAFAMYGALIGAVYIFTGGKFLRAIWFPLVYLAFSLPPPETIIAAVTQPMKIAISKGAVSFLYALGYPVANSGVEIQIAQFQLLVAAACAGLNSIVTLSALCIFYVYLRHRSNPITFLFVCVAVIPIAMFSNFVRVVILVLITYYLGEAAAQGFMHELAGLTLFAVALLSLFALDQLATPLLRRRNTDDTDGT